MFILSKNDSQKIKGLAILCMIFYHLFAFPERIPEKAVLPWMGTDIIKSFSICVPIYLFMAGYGLQCTIMKKGTSISDCFNRVIKLYINYWWVAIPFIIIGTCIHYYYPNNPRVLILNIIGMQSTYNGEWWFYSLYIELLIIFYLSIGKLKLKLLPYTIFMIVLLFLTRIINRVITFEISNIWQHHLHMIIVNLNIFIMGCYFAKFGIFTYIFDKYNKLFRKIYLVPFFLILPLLIRAYLPLKGITDGDFYKLNP